MALIRTGDASQLSGSVGGVTYSHNRYGAYKRARSLPVNPDTGNQQAIRAALAAVSTAWRSLTGAQRAGWNQYAETLSRLNALGDPITLSGQAAFVSNLSSYVYTGGSLTGNALNRPDADGDAPALDLAFAKAGEFIVLGATGSTGTPAENTLLVDWSNIPNFDDGASPAAFIQMSQPFDPGRLFFKGPYVQRTLYNNEVATGEPTGVKNYPVVSGNVPTSTRMWVRIRAMDTPRRWSPPGIVVLSATVTAP